MNLNRIFDGLLSSGVAGGVAGGAASALLVQGLSGKKGRKALSKAAKLGGAAVVGGLAWKAYEHYRADRNDTTASAVAPQDLAATLGSAALPNGEQGAGGTSASLQAGDGIDGQWAGIDRQEFLPDAAAPAARRDLLVLRAMIAAAHADGHIDGAERLKIFDRIESLSLSHAEKGLLMEEIGAPLGIDQLAQQVPDRALAAEVYVAALLVADTPAPAHQLFLHDLAERLDLPAGFVRAMHEEVAQKRADAALAMERTDV